MSLNAHEPCITDPTFLAACEDRIRQYVKREEARMSQMHAFHVEAADGEIVVTITKEKSLSVDCATTFLARCILDVACEAGAGVLAPATTTEPPAIVGEGGQGKLWSVASVHRFEPARAHAVARRLGLPSGLQFNDPHVRPALAAMLTQNSVRDPGGCLLWATGEHAAIRVGGGTIPLPRVALFVRGEPPSLAISGMTIKRCRTNPKNGIELTHLKATLAKADAKEWTGRRYSGKTISKRAEQA